MKTTPDFARFGIAVAGILAFSREWGADLFEGLEEVAKRYGVPYQDDERDAIREAAERNGINPYDLGDESPSVTFTGELDADAAKRVTLARRRVHDVNLANEVGTADWGEENEALTELVDALESYAGIRVK